MGLQGAVKTLIGQATAASLGEILAKDGESVASVIHQSSRF